MTGSCFDNVDLSQGWQSAVLRFASDVREMNTDKSAQDAAAPPEGHGPVGSGVLRHGSRAGEQATTTLRRRSGSIGRVSINLPNGAGCDSIKLPLGEGYRRFRGFTATSGARPRQLEVRLDRAGWSAHRPGLPATTPKPEDGPDDLRRGRGRTPADADRHARRLPRVSVGGAGALGQELDDSSISASSNTADKSRCRRTR